MKHKIIHENGEESLDNECIHGAICKVGGVGYDDIDQQIEEGGFPKDTILTERKYRAVVEGAGENSDHDMPGCSRNSNFELGNSCTKNLFPTSLESTQGNGHIVVALLVLLIAVIFWCMSKRE